MHNEPKKWLQLLCELTLQEVSGFVPIPVRLGLSLAVLCQGSYLWKAASNKCCCYVTEVMVLELWLDSGHIETFFGESLDTWSDPPEPNKLQ